jgi:PEP-CTERM motif
MKNYVMALLATAAVGAFASTAQAGIVLFDNFTTTDSVNQVPTLNWLGDNTFVPVPATPVTGKASVDLVGPSNPYGITPPPLAPTLNVVDMDGSTGTGFSPAGEIQSVDTTLAAGSYTLSFWISGNQRTSAARSVDVSLGSWSKTIGPLSESSPWTLETFSFSTNGGALSFIEPGPANQQGDLITDVTLSSVPEASTWAMMMLGFAGLGFAAYRKARPAVSIA